MFFQGLSTTTAVIAGAAAGSVLLALFLLKKHRKEHLVPSVMLWQNGNDTRLRARLWHKFSRILHFLLLLCACAALLSALTRPVWEYRDIPYQVIVAEESALPDAIAFAQKADKGRTILVAASETPLLLHGLRSATPWQTVKVPATQVRNSADGLLLASLLQGSHPARTVYFGANAPAWLPSGGSWIQAGETAQELPTPSWKLFVEQSESEALPPGFEAVATAAGADAIVARSSDVFEPMNLSRLLYRLRGRGNRQTDWAQQIDIAPQSVHALEHEHGEIPLENILWAIVFVLLILDLGGWAAGKLV